MKIDSARAKGLVEALQSVQSRVAKASAGAGGRRNVCHVTPLSQSQVVPSSALPGSSSSIPSPTPDRDGQSKARKSDKKSKGEADTQ